MGLLSISSWLRACLVLMFALSLGSPSLHGQEYCALANTYYNASNIDRALLEYIKCRETYWEKEDYAGYVNATWMVMDCHSKRSETTALLKEIDHLRDLRELVPDSIRTRNALVIRQFEFLLARMTGDLGAALDIQLRILDSLEALHGPPTKDRIARVSKSQMYVAEAYLEMGSYRQAIYYANKSIDNAELIREITMRDGFILTPHYVLVSTYLLTEDYRKALDELNRILSIIPGVQYRQSERKINTYSELSRLHMRHGSLDSAALFLRQMRLEPAAGQFSVVIARLQADLYRSSGRLDEAVSIYADLADSLGAVEDYDREILGEIYTALGEVLLQMDRNVEAAESFHRAVHAMSSEQWMADFHDNPSLDSLYEKTTLITTLNGKARAISAIASEESNDRLHAAAWSTIGLVLKYIERMRQGYQTAEDKAELIEASYLVFEEGMRQCFLRSDNGRDKSWNDTAFVLMEKSKALNLFDDLTHKRARELAGIPDSLIRLELAITADINKYKKREREYRTDPSVGDSELRMILELQQAAEMEYDSLLGQFSTNYSMYEKYQTSYSSTSLSEAMEVLGPDESILEYFAGKSAIYLLNFGHETSQFVRIEETENLKIAAGVVAENIRQVLSESDQQVTNGVLLSALHELWTYLVEPAESRRKHLIIIPDGMLHTIPYAALLTSPAEQDYDLRDQPYLVNDHTVLYGYSSAIFIQLRTASSRSDKISYAFSPEIDPASGFAPLDYSFTEAEIVGRDIGASVLAGRSCTASAVKDLLEEGMNFEVMHFATHGFADMNHGADSYLQFSGATDTSRLFAYELYNRDFNASLIYLSACQTAAGSVQKGEGIVSMARAFFKSGSRNLVTTVGNVGDFQAQTLTKSFYEHLMSGHRVDGSLALAQRAYLDELKTEERYMGHPAYWSGFVAYGDAMPVYRKSYLTWINVSLFLLLIAAGVFLLRKKKSLR